MDFKNVIIMSDLDGTLLDDKKEISQRDMESINEFCDKGGMFTIATGRGYSMARPVAQKLKLRIPAVIFNGSAVYDFDKDEFLWQSEVTQKARDYIKLVMDRFPDVGIEVLHKHTVYVPALNDVERAHMALENVHGDVCRLDDIPHEGWLKVLFAYPEDKMPELARFIDEHCAEGTNRVLSVTGSEDRFTVAAGDYPNDAEMVRSADLGVAVSNAHDEVKSSADVIIGSNNEDPMTQIIDIIRKM